MHSAIGGPQIRKNVWRALVDAQKEGLVKSIGVSLAESILGEF
jgi:diketogulonate reductase-like aldo/keto reductase